MKSEKMKRINGGLKTRIAVMVLACAFICGDAAESAMRVEDKLALEDYTAKRIEDIVGKMLGDGGVVALVTIKEMEPEKKGGQAVDYEAMRKAAERARLLRERGRNVLPGIPGDMIDESMITADPMFLAGMESGPLRYTRSIKVIVGSNITGAMLENIRTYVTDFLGLDSNAGDSLEVKKAAFAIKDEKQDWLTKELVVQQWPWVVGLILGTIFVFGTLRTFMNKLVSAIEVFRIQADTRVIDRSEMGIKRKGEGLMVGGGNGGMLPEMGGMGGMAGLGMGGGMGMGVGDQRMLGAAGGGVRHFDFINETNIKSLIYLLKNEAPGTVAMVMVYLPREYLSLVIDGLPSETRVETLKLMAQVKQYKSEDVRQVEEDLREKVNYLLGGPQSIADLINVYEPTMRDKIIMDIAEENPSVAEDIRRMLVTVEDLRKLAKEQLYEVYKAVGSRLFAAALKGTSDEVREHVMGNLTEGARDMLRQEMEMIGSSITASRLDQVKKEVIGAMRSLENQGLIKIPRGME